MNKKYPEPHTTIVLASFNGADFLRAQIDSLLAQNEPNWELLICDDDSTDGSQGIIREFAQKDSRIEVLESASAGRGSALENFSNLLGAAYARGADFVFCCDQDDVWEPDKLERMLARLRELEGDAKAPSLVHHDLAVVDESLQPLADSFIDLMQLRPADEHNPQRLISRNEVTGCAMAFNRALLEVALPIPGEAVMHDWWLALCAGYFGRLHFMPDTLVKYRQHGANAIGAKSFWHGLNPFTNWVAGWRRGDEEFISTVRQARAFKEAMADRLQDNPEALTALELYSGLLSATRLQRLKSLRQFELWRNHWFLNVVLVLRMVLLPRKAES